MPKYRHALPQLSGKLFLSDGGLETTLVFHDGMDLPCFASFDLMKSAEGVARLDDYYRQYAVIARDAGVGFVFESVTWRASRDWGAKLGYSAEELADVNVRAIGHMAELRSHFDSPLTPGVVSANIGPRGDGYSPDRMMSADEAEDYHAWQVQIFRDTQADMVSAFTMNYAAEAIGIARAAKAARMPVVISFTTETDGRLPTGQPLKEAIAEVDAETGWAPAYFMINCAHPTHFSDVLAAHEPWVRRIRGIRANSSKSSHAELDNATEIDAGNPQELGEEYAALRQKHPHINVLGGCCGTDHRHVEAISRSCAGHRHIPAYAA